MRDDIVEPSQLAVDKLLSLIEADGNIPMHVKQLLFSTIPTRERSQIETLTECLTKLAKGDEDQEYPTE